MSDPDLRPKPRIASLDQFRGYTVAGMLLVNFFSGYACIPDVFKHHHTYCSYADTIMPQFFFAVGYAYRLTLLKRIAREGSWKAFRHVISRAFGLMLLGFIVYHLDGGVESWDELSEEGIVGFFQDAFQRSWFQTLVHIAITSLWILPVISRSVALRVAFMVASAILHLALSNAFFFDWAMGRPVIDGGQLGFLSWTTPMLIGSIAFDLMTARGPRQALLPLTGMAAITMAIGYGLSCLGGTETSSGTPALGWAAYPFWPPEIETNLWTMSQRAGSVTYLTFSAGFSTAVFVLFVLLSDLGPLQIGVFRTFGRNALAVYVLHTIVFGAVKPYVPKDSPAWYGFLGFAVAFGITYLLIRHLERQEIYLKL